MLPRPPAPRARGYLVGPTARQRDLSRTNVGIGGGLPVPQSRRSSARVVNTQQRTSLGAGLTNTKQDVVTAKPQPNTPSMQSSSGRVQRTPTNRRPRQSSSGRVQRTPTNRRPRQSSSGRVQRTSRRHPVTANKVYKDL